MSTAAGYVTLIIDPVVPTGFDATQPCNKCVHGRIQDPQHASGEYLCTYQPVDCPLCGKVGVRTRPKVRRKHHFICGSPLAEPKL